MSFLSKLRGLRKPQPKGSTENTSVHITLDISGPGNFADCLDSLVAFPAAIEQMRSKQDVSEIPNLMIKDIKARFRQFDAESDSASMLATAAIDTLYRHIAALSVMDIFTEAYCALVVREFFHQLSLRKVTAFYILDNTLRTDRFDAGVKLFYLSGIKVISPRTHGADWSELKSQILSRIEEGQHTAYVEPDAAVDHIESALALAKELRCVSTFRNLAPEDAQFRILGLGS